MSNQPGAVQKFDYITAAEVAAGDALQPGAYQKANFPAGIPGSELASGAAADGQVLTADGAGAAAFEGPAEYIALLTQAGAGAPTETEVKNNLSAAIVWTRTGAGVYVGTLAGAFTVDEKTIIVIIPDGTATNGDADLTTPADATGTFHIEIRVYP